MTALAQEQSMAVQVPDAGDLLAWGDRKLDNEIRKGHSVAGAHMRNYEQAATVTGVLLRERKRRLAHGEWMPWVGENFDGHHNTALEYIRLADEHVPNSQPTVNLTANNGSSPDPEIVDAEPVPDEPRKPRPPDPDHAAYYLPDLVSEDADVHLRTQAVHWFAQGVLLQRLLDGQTPFTVRSDEDRTAMQRDAVAMASLATSLQEAISSAVID